MGYGVFENELTKLGRVPIGQEDVSVIKTRRVSTEINVLQCSVLHKTNFTLSVGNDNNHEDLRLDFASSNKIHPGAYEVYQKWIYPYGKSKNYFFYPSLVNPLGKYLVILRSLDSSSVMPYGIHQWFNWDGNGPEFQKGFVDNPGCIRIKPEEMEQVFHALYLGSKIQVI